MDLLQYKLSQFQSVDTCAFQYNSITSFPWFNRWMEDHCDKLEEDEDCLCNALDEKDAYLSNLDEDFLFELMLAANFLDVPGLLDALAKVLF